MTHREVGRRKLAFTGERMVGHEDEVVMVVPTMGDDGSQFCGRCGRVHEEENGHQLFKCSECDAILCANQVIRPKGLLSGEYDNKWIHQCYATRRGSYSTTHRSFRCGPVEPVWRNIAGIFKTGVECSRCEGVGEVLKIDMVCDLSRKPSIGEHRCLVTCQMCKGLGFISTETEGSRIFRETPSGQVFIPCLSGDR